MGDEVAIVYGVRRSMKAYPAFIAEIHTRSFLSPRPRRCCLCPRTYLRNLFFGQHLSISFAVDGARLPGDTVTVSPHGL
jgi:hypothetical protein